MHRSLLMLPLAALLGSGAARAAGLDASAPPVLASAAEQVLGDAAEGFGGCALCRNSGNCSIAVGNAASGVFCGDLAASKEPCCCSYQAECLVTQTSSVCECASDEDFYRSARDRLQAQDAATPEYEDTQISVSTEILIHLSVYLALFVIATFVDDWVECCRDFRRSQVVYDALDKGILKMKDKYRRRRRRKTAVPARPATLFSDSEEEEEEDSLGESTGAPLLLGMSPVARTPDVQVELESDGESVSRPGPVEEMQMDRVA